MIVPRSKETSVQNNLSIGYPHAARSHPCCSDSTKITAKPAIAENLMVIMSAVWQRFSRTA